VTDVVLFLAFAAFAFTALRNAVWFVLISSPIVARCLRSVDVGAFVGRLSRSRRPDAARREQARRPSLPPVRYGLNAAIAIVMVAVAAVLSPWVRPLLSSRGRDVWVDARTPVGAVNYLAQRGIRDRVFHPEIYGDYLVWRLWPQQRSFVDSRIHLFWQCPSVLDDYDLAFVDSQWDERLARYGVRYLMLSKEETGEAAMIEGARQSAGWRVVYEDRSTVIFEKSLQVSATCGRAR
jgi:hypothetical protein